MEIIIEEVELINLLKQKSEKGFSYLYDNYSGALNNILSEILGKDNTADVLQETFIKIWRNIDQYDSEKGRIYTWMYRIARNLALDTLRSSHFKWNKSLTQIDTDPRQERMLFHTTRIEHVGVKSLINNLKQEWSAILNLSYFLGYTTEEVAKILNIPIGTVKTRNRNAILHLRQVMNFTNS